MEEAAASNKAIICFHRRSKRSKSTITSHRDAASSDQSRGFKNGEKPILCSHPRSKSSKSTTSPMILKAAPLLMEEEEEKQQTHQMGKKRKIPTVRPEEEEKQQTHQMGKKRKKSTVQLPEDIIHGEILTRLPAKYLMRFRLVCKSWNSLFLTSEFAKSHLTRQHSYLYKDDEDLIIAIGQKYYAPGYGLYIVSLTNQVITHPVPAIYETLLGSINGLVCLSSPKGQRFCLWNPAVDQFKDINLPSEHPENCTHFLGGLSWDHMRNDYKVVVVCYDLLASSPSHLSIYSSNSASWTQVAISDSALPHASKFGSQLLKPPSTIVKGIPYWSYSYYALLPGKQRKCKLISAFKFVAENNEFRLLPEFKSSSIRGKEFNIVNIKDCLVGMAYKTNCPDSLVDIYSLDKESHTGVWRKMYTIGPINLGLTTRRPSQCFRNGGEILLDVGIYDWLSFYDPKTKEKKYLGCEDYYLVKTSLSYTPSLVCVQGMESMQQFIKKNGVPMYYI